MFKPLEGSEVQSLLRGLIQIEVRLAQTIIFLIPPLQQPILFAGGGALYMAGKSGSRAVMVVIERELNMLLNGGSHRGIEDNLG